MNAVIYTRDNEEYSVIKRLLGGEADISEIHRAVLDGHTHYAVRYDIAIIALDGAEGMEIMLEVNDRYPDTQIIWITEDKNFVGMAIRRHICGFIPKPYSEDTVLAAVREAAERLKKNTTWHFGRKKV